MGNISPDEARQQIWDLARDIIDAALKAQAPVEPPLPPVLGHSAVTEQYHGVFHAYVRR